MSNLSLSEPRHNQEIPGVTVIIYAYQQSAFITRALASLLAQSYQNWEAVIIDDASTDETENLILPFLEDSRFTVLKNPEPLGLGASLNLALLQASTPLIAYLPADDLYHRDHLESLVQVITADENVVAAHSGVRYFYNKETPEKIDGFPLQLVQVMHRRVPETWLEQTELVTDDLHKLYWHKLDSYGTWGKTLKVTCDFVDYPQKLYKRIQEPIGGINGYRQYYRVKHPLRFKTTTGNFMDEVGRYKRFRQVRYPSSKTGLKIVLVGELAYNPERVLALAEQGQQLYGLWMDNPYWYNYVGPLPFGHVQDLDTAHWQAELARIKPDLIYGLLNWQAIPFAHQVITQRPKHIPFVWHFKEGPFIAFEKGIWQELFELFSLADGVIYSSPEMRAWFHQFFPKRQSRELVLDGDLPKKDWFTQKRSPKLSAKDGELHTVVPGRPIGLHPYTVEELAKHKIHLHFYGNFVHGQWLEWIAKTKQVAGRFFHLHDNVDQEQWVSEFSQYDAGWLHFFKSKNNGDLMRANWDDLNYPARMATLAVAGLPMLQQNNTGHIVATQALAQQKKLGFLFDEMSELAQILNDQVQLKKVSESVWQQRELFMFDSHVEKLISFFAKVVSHHQPRSKQSKFKQKISQDAPSVSA